LVVVAAMLFWMPGGFLVFQPWLGLSKLGIHTIGTVISCGCDSYCAMGFGIWFSQVGLNIALNRS